MIGLVIFRKFSFPLTMLVAVTIAACGLNMSGCSFGDQDNVGAIGDAQAAAPSGTPQVPESMKTNDMGNGPQGPPQGL
jgi:hypothetical protein